MHKIYDGTEINVRNGKEKMCNRKVLPPLSVRSIAEEHTKGEDKNVFLVDNPETRKKETVTIKRQQKRTICVSSAERKKPDDIIGISNSGRAWKS